MLTHAILDELKRSVRLAAGEERASEVLFRLGHMIGAVRSVVGDSLRERLQCGLDELIELGIAQLDVEELVQDEGGFHLVASVTVPRTHSGAAEAAEVGDDGPMEGATCGLVAGFVTGLSATLSGVDLVCDWLECPTACGSSADFQACCRFQVRAAHLGPARAADGGSRPTSQRPEGSAAFYLGDVGTSLGHEPISLGDFLQATPDGIVILGLDQRVRFWNRGAEQMFGYTTDEMVGRDFRAIVPEDLIAAGEAHEIQRLAAAEGGLNNHMTKRRTRDGRVLDVSLTRTVLRGESGRVLGSIGVLRDLTAHRETERELERASHLARIGELSATLAHDIKNPLAAIYAAVQYLARDEVSLEERRGILDQVGQAVHRVDETIQDLLRFARPSPPVRDPVRMEALVRRVLAEVKLAVDMAHHEVDLQVDGDLELLVDEAMVARALRNLVVNGYQAMDTPGVLGLRVWRDGDQAVLEVRDQGDGVPDEVGSGLFEPFVTSKVRGTGLGLPVARRYAEAHGGTLELHETGPEGTAFHMTLPLARPDTAS